MGGVDYTAASHCVFIYACIVAGVRMIGLSSDWQIGLLKPSPDHGLPASTAMMMGAFILERAYYIAARALQPEFDLWEMHPAPELLSIFVALFVLNMSWASLKRRGVNWRVIQAGRLLDLMFSALIWLVAFVFMGGVGGGV